MRRRRLKTLLIVLLAVIAIPAALYALGAAYFVFIPSAEDYAHRRKFDATLWQAPPKEDDPEWPVRLCMVDDLVSSKSLDRLTRREVEALLGRDDETDKWKDWDLVYWLGPERRGMFRIDSEWLVIRFGSEGRVAVYRVVGD
jgi:hypothetical protein